MKEILRLQNLSKQDNAQKVSNLSFRLLEGEILGLVSRNQLDFSLIMQLLSGQQKPDSGFLYLMDEKVTEFSERSFKARGVYCIRQDSLLIPDFSVAENLFAQNGTFFYHPGRFQAIIKEETRDILRRLGIPELAPDCPAKEIHGAARLAVEIARGVVAQARLFVIDAVFDKYTEQDFLLLSKVLLHMKDMGISTIFLTDRFHPLFSLADSIVILRYSSTVALLRRGEITSRAVNDILMPNQPVHDIPVPVRTQTERLMEIERLCLHQAHSLPVLIHHKEIVGLFHDDWRTSTGTARRLGQGCCAFPPQVRPQKGAPRALRTPQDCISCGIGYIPELPQKNLLFSNMSLIDNVMLNIPDQYYNAFLINQRLKSFAFRNALKELGFEELLPYQKGPLPEFSAIHQFRILTAKWFCANMQAIVMENPFSCFDEIDFYQFQRILERLKELDISALLFSSNYEKLAKVCDRIIRL